jgi:thiol:disulfide interchange protein
MSDLLPRPRFRLATLLVAMVPLGVVFLHLRWWLDVPPELKWHPYSPQLVEQELAKGKTVVVHFAARWDPSGIWNLQLFNSSQPLRRYVHKRPITLVCADWTDESPVVTTAMHDLGLQSIPATAIFRPDDTKPRVMPDIVSASEVIAELERTKPR